jgi:tripartite-type tricarboxylate transporter receptor subunit TctC
MKNPLTTHHSLLTLFALALLATEAAAQAFPARPVRVIVPFAPGGSTDVVFRVIAPRVTELLGQPLLVDNRPGGGATIGMDLVAKAPPDGHTLGVANISFGANPSLLSKLPYDTARDFAPVSMVSIVTMVLAVHPSLPARSVKDVLALAKKSPDGLTYGSAGNGSATHLAFARFNHASGAKILHVPYKGGGPAVVSAVSGETMTLFATIPSAIQHFQTGRLVPLGVSSPRRNAALPKVPTVAEAGVPGYEATIWLGLMAPAGTPQPIVDKLNAEIGKVLSRPEVRDNWAKQGAVPLQMTPAEFGKYLRDDIEKWAKVVKLSGAKVQ